MSWGGVGPAPLIILDYGRDVGDLPLFQISSVSGTPLQAAQLATALCHADVAATYTNSAGQLRAAINANLFNASTGPYDMT